MLPGLPFFARSVAFVWILFLGAGSSVAAPFISEFMADNASGVTDQDGAFSDWIEISNPEATTVNLEGWRLTDDSAERSKWIFPAGIALPPGGRLLVFASGKNRRTAGAELHTSFNLRKEGEYLGLFPPSGDSPASEFAPSYPPQRTDVSYGWGVRESDSPLIPEGAPAKIFIPAADDVSSRWTGAVVNEPFPDDHWISGTTRAGYDDSSAQLLGYWSFDDVTSPRLALDTSGRNSHGTLLGPAAYTGPGGGRSGTLGDRAIDFGAANNNASVRIAAAAAGGFDVIEQRDQLTVSLWAFGGPQLPVANCAFWFDSGGAAGDTRNAMVHLPWSDSVIYFDTAGCCAGDTRISRQESDATKWRGRWNHYVFLKDGPRKEIWQNGVRWQTGSGAIPLKPIKSLWLGSGLNAGISYPGKLDEVAIWAEPLSPRDIQSLAAGGSPLEIGGYRPWITTDLTVPMRGVSARAWMRIPFRVPENFRSDVLRLRLRYDDGFVAWINGLEVGRQNVPVLVDRSKPEGNSPAEFDFIGGQSRLRTGLNILALTGANSSASNSDFLLTAELRGGQLLPGRFFTTPTPSQANNAGVRGFVEDPVVDPGRGFFEGPETVKLTSPTPGARLIYTPDGSLPTDSNGVVVLAPDAQTPPELVLTVNSNFVLRALAVRDDFLPSKVVTHTYLFAGQVESQPASIPGFPSAWGVYGAYGPTPGKPVPADYAMDPRVTRTTASGYSVREAIESLPTVCISMAMNDLFDPATGIYANSAAQGEQWVRPASAEMIFPDGRPGFQIDAGIRVHGGLSRQHWHARKHSFRLNFSREFGPTKLSFRLFDDTRVTTFNELTLRASSTDGWAVEDAEPWTRRKATYMRDVWIKDTQQAMGRPCGHSRYVHLFLNGVYWGQYNLAERTEPVWLSENFGGDPEEWDIIKDGGEVEHGDRITWDGMIAMASAGLATDAAYWKIQGRNLNGTVNPALPVYLNVDSLIDYLILHIYSGAIDWPNHNWWAGRRRGPLSDGFRFFAWDQEISNISLTATTTYTGEAFASVSGPQNSPAFLYAKLRLNPMFRARFSARVIALTTGFGILTPAQNSARWERRQAEIDHAIVAESARWGDSRQATPLKRSDWMAEMNWMRKTYWPRNHDLAIVRFRSVGLYSPPAGAGITMTPPGGIVSPNTTVRLTGNPPIYYTTNGVNPVTATGDPSPGAFLYSDLIPIVGPTEIRAQMPAPSGAAPVVIGRFLLATNVAPAEVVAISEIHYHPAGNEAEEFVEVLNTSATQHVIFGGGRLSGAVDFVFPNRWILAPWERAVVVRDRVAFATRYGTDRPVVGEFAGQLANEGEWMQLLAPSGLVLSRFRYDRDPPWPVAANGGDRSLTRVHAAYSLDPAKAAHWRASFVSGGTPGGDDGLAFTGDPAVDADGDGLPALMEYFLGSRDDDSQSGPARAATVRRNRLGELTITMRRSLLADQAELLWEESADLAAWASVTEWPAAIAEPIGDEEVLTWTLSPESAERKFYRVRLILR